MPQHRHQTFDKNGNLIKERIEEYNDPAPSPKELAKEKMRSSNSIATLRTAILEYMEAEENL